MGQEAADFSRLYMVPGMQHCGGGPGPNSFREPMRTALERWVENGAAPDTVIAVKYKVDGDPTSGVIKTRPLCPYPQVARYNGSGSIDEASKFRLSLTIVHDCTGRLLRVEKCGGLSVTLTRRSNFGTPRLTCPGAVSHTC